MRPALHCEGSTPLRDAVSFSGKLLVYEAYDLSRVGAALGGEGGGLLWVEGGEIQRELGVICEIRGKAMSLFHYM